MRFDSSVTVCLRACIGAIGVAGVGKVLYVECTVRPAVPSSRVEDEVSKMQLL